MTHTHTYIYISKYIYTYLYISIRLLKNAVNHKVGCYKFKHTCLFSFVHVLANMTSSKTTPFQGNKEPKFDQFYSPFPWKKNTSARAWYKCGWWNWTTKKRLQPALQTAWKLWVGWWDESQGRLVVVSCVMCWLVEGNHIIPVQAAIWKQHHIEAVWNSYQLMVHWWFGARWFGIRIGVPLSNHSFHFWGSQESKPPTN